VFILKIDFASLHLFRSSSQISDDKTLTPGYIFNKNISRCCLFNLSLETNYVVNIHTYLWRWTINNLGSYDPAGCSSVLSSLRHHKIFPKWFVTNLLRLHLTYGIGLVWNVVGRLNIRCMRDLYLCWYCFASWGNTYCHCISSCPNLKRK
jgi:hypothetical protein